MKRIASTLIVAGILFGTAVYYGVRADTTPDNPTPPPDTPSHAPPTTSQSSDGTLTLEAATSQGYLPTGERETLYASVDIHADNRDDTAARPPLNVALVIDRSGSMRGKKIRQVRQAARTIADMLDADDRLSIVSYQSEATVNLDPQRVSRRRIEQIHHNIDGIRAGGGTNIEAGIQKAERALASTKTEQSVNRIVLLTDGKPTVGASSIGGLSRMAKQANRESVSMTTMGVGLDYNEQLLTKMANVGGGNYYFIDAPGKVVSMFEKELGGLAETVAKRASLVIELGDDIELDEAYGYPGDTSEDRVRVALSEFSAGQTKSVLLEMRGRLTDAEPSPVIDVDLSYNDLVDQRPAHQRASLTAAASDDAATVDDSIDREVISRVQQIEVASRIDAAMEAFDQGDETRAERVLETSQKKVRRAKSKYDLPDKTLKPVNDKLKNVQKEVESHSSRSGAGQTVIKRQRAESNKIKLDSTALE